MGVLGGWKWCTEGEWREEEQDKATVLEGSQGWALVPVVTGLRRGVDLPEQQRGKARRWGGAGRASGPLASTASSFLGDVGSTVISCNGVERCWALKREERLQKSPT